MNIHVCDKPIPVDQDECIVKCLSESALVNIARAVANLIEQDGAKESFIKASQEDQMQIGLAYADELSRRIVRLQNLFLTNPEFKNMFYRKVFNICKSKE